MNRNLFNNVLVNRIAIFLGVDKYLKRSNDYWSKYQIIPGKTQQEIAGYSHNHDVQEAVDRTHEMLKVTSKKYITAGAGILDIGCGPGLYLKDFGTDYQLSGIDINANMLALAKKNNPNAVFINGEFIAERIDKKFSLIYSVGMLQYISKGEISAFFNKIYDLLESGGIVFVSYPHAIHAMDLSYPDLNYINYSPLFLNKLLSEKFLILQNKHVIDDREVEDFDKSPYSPSIKAFDKTYRNSSILIAQKKS